MGLNNDKIAMACGMLTADFNYNWNSQLHESPRTEGKNGVLWKDVVCEDD